jgi:hypothetical protein
MNPIYFPFTALLPETAPRLKSCFLQTTVYRIGSTPGEPNVASPTDDGSIRYRIPVQGDEERLAAVLREYKTWADIHDRTIAAFLKAQSSPVPFYNDTSVSKIRMDLKNRVSGKGMEKSNEPDEDDTFAARLFLALAQEHDSHTAGVVDDLISIEKIEQDLYDRLKGEPEDIRRLQLTGGMDVHTDPGAHMTEERIRSWALMFLRDTGVFDVFVTDSRAVLNVLIDGDKEDDILAEPVVTLDSVSMENNTPDAGEFSRSFCRLLGELGETPQGPHPLTLPEIQEPEPGKKSVSVTVYVAWGVPPQHFFSRFVPGAKGVQNDLLPSPVKNTVICLIR